jgi:signal transduction histidine kinase
MAAGDNDARVETRRSGILFSEFADLGVEFNYMAEAMQEARTRETTLRIEAEQATVAKSRFLATMSHEIRTPMNGVLGLGALLRTTELNERQQLYTDRIMDSGEALMGVLNDILDYSQIEAGQLPISAAPFDLSDVAASVVNFMSAEPEHRGVSLTLDADPAVGIIVGDGQRTRQILLNLVGNAVKFTEQGTIIVSLKLTDDGSFVRVSVKDTGIGIPAAAQPAIFTDFMQVDQSHSRSQGGSGLGLAICKRLAEAQGGEIGFTSEEGNGAEFWFTLPINGAPTAPATAA